MEKYWMPKSGFTLERIMHLHNLHMLELTKGSFYTESTKMDSKEEGSDNKKIVINQQCFKWTITAELQQKKSGNNQECIYYSGCWIQTLHNNRELAMAAWL